RRVLAAVPTRRSADLVLFGPVHEQLGGNLKYLVSGAAALPKDDHRTFQSLGLHLAEGYRLTEAAPVLTLAKASPRNKGGNVGKRSEEHTSELQSRENL